MQWKKGTLPPTCQHYQFNYTTTDSLNIQHENSNNDKRHKKPKFSNISGHLQRQYIVMKSLRHVLHQPSSLIFLRQITQWKLKTTTKDSILPITRPQQWNRWITTRTFTSYMTIQPKQKPQNTSHHHTYFNFSSCQQQQLTKSRHHHFWHFELFTLCWHLVTYYSHTVNNS